MIYPSTNQRPAKRRRRRAVQLQLLTRDLVLCCVVAWGGVVFLFLIEILVQTTCALYMVAYQRQTD